VLFIRLDTERGGFVYCILPCNTLGRKTEDHQSRDSCTTPKRRQKYIPYYEKPLVNLPDPIVHVTSNREVAAISRRATFPRLI